MNTLKAASPGFPRISTEKRGSCTVLTHYLPTAFWNLWSYCSYVGGNACGCIYADVSLLPLYKRDVTWHSHHSPMQLPGLHFRVSTVHVLRHLLTEHKVKSHVCAGYMNLQPIPTHPQSTKHHSPYSVGNTGQISKLTVWHRSHWLRPYERTSPI